MHQDEVEREDEGDDAVDKTNDGDDERGANRWSLRIICRIWSGRSATWKEDEEKEQAFGAISHSAPA